MAEERCLNYYTTLTILTGQTSSGVLDMTTLPGPRASRVAIYGPGTIGQAVTVQVAPKAGSSFCILRSAGTDIAISVSRSDEITVLGAAQLKLVAAGAVAQDTTFELVVSIIQ